MSKIVDLTGQRFGKLVVIGRADDYVYKNGKHRTRWICQCDCGNITIVAQDKLKSGHTKSCGCLSRETASRNHKKYNDYDLYGDYGVGYDCNGKKFYFDLDDYDKIKDYRWYIDIYGYVVCQHEQLRFHRLVMNVTDPNLHIDHINHITYDNRKCNLRKATVSENAFNKTTPMINTSGYKGVTWDKNRGKWVAQLHLHGKHYYLGRYDTLEDAVKARRQAEEKYFGEWSYDNSMKTSEENGSVVHQNKHIK